MSSGRRLGRLASGGLPVVVLLDLLTACGGGSEEAACGLSIEYNGQTYYEVHVEPAPELGEPLGEATVPPCIDTNHQSPSSPSNVTVRRIAGVSAEVAIAYQDYVLLAQGMTALPSPSQSAANPDAAQLKYDSAPPGFTWTTSNFPRNARGLTYGSVATAQSPGQMPDLIAATGVNGVSGFMHKADYLAVEPVIKSPEEAVAWQRQLDAGIVPRVAVYDISGLNQVDTFVFSAGRNAE